MHCAAITGSNLILWPLLLMAIGVTGIGVSLWWAGRPPTRAWGGWKNHPPRAPTIDEEDGDEPSDEGEPARQVEEWEIELDECGCSGTIEEHNLGGGRGCRLDVQGLLGPRDKS